VAWNNLFLSVKQCVPRWVEARLAQVLRVMPVAVVSGPRQAGKTTLAKSVGPHRRFISLDDLTLLEQAQREPIALLEQRPVTVDEVQYVPELLRAVKLIVDRGRVPGDFLLTGSANLLVADRISESLAGRAGYLDLLPFCPTEWTQRPGCLGPIDHLFDADFDPADWPVEPGDWPAWLLRGGFAPALDLPDPADRALWLESYVRTYLERDLRSLSAVSSLPEFQRVMRLAANQCARVINQANLARDAALPAVTTHRYLNLLEAGGLLTRIPAWAGNPTIPVVKSPKWLWTDCGLAAWLAGANGPGWLGTRPDSGFWMEQTLFQTFQTWRSLDPARRRIHFWRDRAGREADFILEQDDGLLGVEIKQGSHVSAEDNRGLEAWRASLPVARRGKVRGVVLNASAHRTLADNLFALPWGWMVPSTVR
jgi:predicted AAA+ superfamily ATPase